MTDPRDGEEESVEQDFPDEDNNDLRETSYDGEYQ